MSSLQSRFTKATIVLLVLFSLSFAALLGRAFHRTLIASEEARLKSVVYTFLSLMDVDEDGSIKVDEAAFANAFAENPEVTVYILDENLKMIWASVESFTQPTSSILTTIGDWQFHHEKKNHSSSLYFGLAWENEKTKQENKYTIGVVDSGKFYRHETSIYRKTLWTWLPLGCLTLLLLQLIMVRWGFRPMQQIANEVSMIEKGKQHKFEQSYPSELAPLTSNINSLLRHERGQQLRYQQALDNLAHALKTPLTAIKNLTMQKSPDAQLQKDLGEQVNRAREIVDYQLGKAKAVGKNPFAKPILILPVIEKISRSIQKVYVQKNIQIDIQIEQDVTVTLDEGDLFEIIGNILENAAKYCKSHIRISFQKNNLVIEDDGTGFDDQKIQSLIQRGVRQDQRTEGSGIGLSVAYEIISAFGGSLELTKSSNLGGASVIIHFG